jgi:hypothetical protein
LDSGLFKRLKYAFLSESWSVAFKTFFAALIIALAIHDLAPGVITSLITTIPMSADISIGNFTDQGSFFDTPLQANVIVQLEQVEGYTIEYTMAPNNCMVGWPDVSFLRNGTAIT